MSGDAVIDTYEVTVTHPDLAGPLVMELIGTSEKAAISRARLSAFHLYRDVRLMDAEYVVTGVKAGVWPDGHQASVTADAGSATVALLGAVLASAALGWLASVWLNLAALLGIFTVAAISFLCGAAMAASRQVDERLYDWDEPVPYLPAEHTPRLRAVQ